MVSTSSIVDDKNAVSQNVENIPEDVMIIRLSAKLNKEIHRGTRLFLLSPRNTERVSV